MLLVPLVRRVLNVNVAFWAARQETVMTYCIEVSLNTWPEPEKLEVDMGKPVVVSIVALISAAKPMVDPPKMRAPALLRPDVSRETAKPMTGVICSLELLSY